jgi:hypothetical protein
VTALAPSPGGRTRGSTPSRPPRRGRDERRWRRPRDYAAATPNGRSTAPAAPEITTAAQAFWLLRIGFTVAPILFGVDKFFNWTVHWPDYLAGWINDIIPGSGQDWMYVVGGIEIAAGLLVAIAPRIGAFVVAASLGALSSTC